jgi:hypothetical protein
MALYRLKEGFKHTELKDGVRTPLKAGDTVELDAERAEALSDRFEPVDPTQPSGVGAKPPGVPGDRPPEWLDGTVPEATDRIAKLKTVEEVDAAIAAESNERAGGKNRKGVLSALDARRAELEG